MTDLSELMPKTAPPHEVLRAAITVLEAGGRAVVATVVERHGSAPSTPGQKLVLFERAGQLAAVGTVGGGAVEREVLQAMAQALADPRSAPRLGTYRLGASLGMCCGGSVEVLIEPLSPAMHVVVIGAGHVGAQLAPLLATLGFAVTLCDAREAAVELSRLTDAASLRVVHADHDDPDVIAGLPSDLSHAIALVMTHDHQLDQDAIAWALARGFGFVGGVGSRAKAARTCARLEARGASAADIARVRMPVGVEIRARSPREIAVAIAAELIAFRAELLGSGRRRDEAEPRA
jgi:xanthine dehydrogenase accessory factor